MCHQTFNVIRPLKFPTAHKAAKPVLVALAAFKNHGTGACFPGVEAIAEALQFSLSTVYAALKYLRESGVIRDITVQYDDRELPGFDIVLPSDGPDFPPTRPNIPATGTAYKEDKPEAKPEAKREAQDFAPPLPRPRKTFVSDILSSSMTDHAAQEGLCDEEVVREHKKFVGTYRAKRASSYDWDALWSVWVQHAVGYRRRHQRSHPTRVAGGDVSDVFSQLIEVDNERSYAHARLIGSGIGGS